jgi:hypothetical protein
MALTAAAIAQKIFEALRDSADILSKCDDLYDRAHSVFRDFSGPDLPSQEYCPLFLVTAENRSEGEGQEDKSFGVSVLLAVVDNTVTEATTPGGVYTAVYGGTAALETLLDLALAAIEAALPDLPPQLGEFLFDPITFYPVLAGEISLTFAYPELAGGYEPTL